MSAAGRGAQRRKGDAYYTPAWAVWRFLEACPLPEGDPLGKRGALWLEPACGLCSIVDAVHEWHCMNPRPVPLWRVCDINPVAISAAVGTPQIDHAALGNYVKGAMDREIRATQFVCCITNPPYDLAQEFVMQAITQCDVVCMLLRLNWLASAERREWLSRNTPDVYVLPNRPDFTGGGGDATDYAWMVWRYLAPGSVSGVPKLRILATTPPGQRRVP